MIEWVLGALGCAYIFGWAFACDCYPDYLIEWCRDFEPYKSCAWFLVPVARFLDAVNKLFKFTLIFGIVHFVIWHFFSSG